MVASGVKSIALVAIANNFGVVGMGALALYAGFTSAKMLKDTWQEKSQELSTTGPDDLEIKASKGEVLKASLLDPRPWVVAAKIISLSVVGSVIDWDDNAMEQPFGVVGEKIKELFTANPSDISISKLGSDIYNNLGVGLKPTDVTNAIGDQFAVAAIEVGAVTKYDDIEKPSNNSFQSVLDKAMVGLDGVKTDDAADNNATLSKPSGSNDIVMG